MMKTKIVKDYATTSSGKWCDLRYDYSFKSYSKCNECMFCYKHIPGVKERKRWHGIVKKKEIHFNEYLFTMPITVSRYCDPLLTESVARQSLDFCEFILDGGGMISFVSPSPNIPDRLFKLAKKYKDRFQYQVVVFTDDSMHGKGCRRILAPRFCDIRIHRENIIKLQKLGIKVIIKIDPIIIGINDTLVDSVMNYFKSIGCYNFILRQLYATDFFKEKLSLISRRIAANLSIPTGKYYTYPGELFFDVVSKIILDHKDCTITFCQNSWMNKILKSHKNCCQFDSAEFIFNDKFTNVDKINNPENPESRLIKA
jgi:DNA repair photolyase